MVTITCSRCGSRLAVARDGGAIHCTKCGLFKTPQPITTSGINALTTFVCKGCGLCVFTTALPADKRCHTCIAKASPPAGTPVAAPDKPAPLPAERFAEVRQRVVQATHSLVMSKQQAEELAELCLVRGRAGDCPSAPRTPHRCPVCEGKGEKPAAFYSRDLVTAGWVPCKACKGVGLVWSP